MAQSGSHGGDHGSPAPWSFLQNCGVRQSHELGGAPLSPLCQDIGRSSLSFSAPTQYETINQRLVTSPPVDNTSVNSNVHYMLYGGPPTAFPILDATIYGQARAVTSPSIQNSPLYTTLRPHGHRPLRSMDPHPTWLQTVPTSAATYQTSLFLPSPTLTIYGRSVCCWGDECGAMLDDVSPAGITRHLKGVHFDDVTNQWHQRNRGVCRWNDMDGLCDREMNFASFGKHIAAVHLRSTARRCPYCHHQLGRADSLDRHMKNYCANKPVDQNSEQFS